MLCRYRAVTKDFFFIEGCLFQVGNGIDLEAVGFQFEPYRWRPCGVTWDSSTTVPNSRGNKAAANLRSALEIKFSWIGEVVADQSSAHCFAQSCDDSLVSE